MVITRSATVLDAAEVCVEAVISGALVCQGTRCVCGIAGLHGRSSSECGADGKPSIEDLS
jgi:hypothetical protein